MNNTKIEKLSEKIDELKNKKKVFLDTIYPENVKSKYLTCSGCGSKIRKDLFHLFRCPACHTEYISDTNKKRIKTYDDKILKLNSEIKALEKKANSKTNNAYSSKYVSSTKRKKVVKIGEDKLIAVKYLNEFESDSGTYMDTVYGIPLQVPCDASTLLTKDNRGSHFNNEKYPYITIEHEEEYYGNDTHGWNAYYNSGNGGLICLASKEISPNTAMTIVKKWITNNYDMIQKDIDMK